jgi:hypothetical protein
MPIDLSGAPVIAVRTASQNSITAMVRTHLVVVLMPSFCPCTTQARNSGRAQPCSGGHEESRSEKRGVGGTGVPERQIWDPSVVSVFVSIGPRFVSIQTPQAAAHRSGKLSKSCAPPWF